MKSARARSPQSWNRYAYVGGDPINRNDPSGRLYMLCDPDDPFSCPGWGSDDGGDGGYDDGWDQCSDYGDDMFDPSPNPACYAAAPPPKQALPTPDCNALTQAVGFAGLTYSNALEVWNDLSQTAGADDVAVAALGVVTWAGESGFSAKPLNNGNINKTVDIGPFQLNYQTWKSSIPASQRTTVFGTNILAGQAFNGNADANMRVRLTYVSATEPLDYTLARTTRVARRDKLRSTHTAPNWRRFSALRIASLNDW
jgi:hypothetical protein